MIIPQEIANRLKFRKPTAQESQILPVESIEPILKPCEDCGDVVNRELMLTRIDIPEPYWRVKCMNCSRYQNPTTGKYDLLDTRAVSTVLKANIKKRDK